MKNKIEFNCECEGKSNFVYFAFLAFDDSSLLLD